VGYIFKDKKVLIIGGTGSFGHQFISRILETEVKKVYCFSRDELKQFEMRQKFEDKRLCFFIGDIRDYDRLLMAFKGIDYVIHAAALKQVPACEFNPFEAIKTNIIGAQNIIQAAIERGVRKVIALSTDKAVAPINLYGATKLCMEKLFIAANNYVGEGNTKFSCVRYGNVIGSRGSVIPLWLKAEKEDKEFLLTDIEMTRFWITLDQAVNMVFIGFRSMLGSEVFVPWLKAIKMVNLAKAINSKRPIKIIGIRPGEKIHETLISLEESSRAFSNIDGDFYVIVPDKKMFSRYRNLQINTDFEDYREYSSNNADYLKEKEIKEMIECLK